MYYTLCYEHILDIVRSQIALREVRKFAHLVTDAVNVIFLSLTENLNVTKFQVGA